MVYFFPGQYLKNLCEDALGFVFGLTTNEDGNIFTINSNSRAKNKEGNPTAKGEIDIIEIDVATNSIVRQIELADIIQEHHMFSRIFFSRFFSQYFFVVVGFGQIISYSGILYLFCSSQFKFLKTKKIS